MNIFEALKKTFLSDIRDNSKLSNDPDLNVNLNTLSDDPYGGAMVVNQIDQTENFNYFGEQRDQYWYQNNIINGYRELAGNAEVNNGINIIVNEMVWTLNPDIMKLSIDEENEKISEAINEKFKEVLSIINIRENIFSMARQFYIDGQLNVALSYKKNKDISQGIQTAHVIDPINLYFDRQDKKWKYQECQEDITLYDTNEQTVPQEFTEAEMVHVDYGLYTKVRGEEKTIYQMNLGYLENVGKVSNMLDTLENMLVPFRYSRSVSRRLFNIDVADLPPKQAQQAMATIRAEFRYKKNYDPATGQITNMKGTQPMVEDYWMSNRGGSKGTTVDTMDEKGAIMDLEDIKHAAKKMYAAMQIPDEFNPYSEDPGSFGFDNTEITQSLMKFYIFISRLRIPLTKLIKEILRRQLIATGVFQDSEWKDYEKKITIEFTAESIFIENMSNELFLKGLDAFINMRDEIGKSISLETAVDKSFGWSTAQLADELEKINQEKINPLYSAFYDAPDTEGSTPAWRA